MTPIKVNIPGFGIDDGDTPIVILGPNGSGKTQLAQKIAKINQVSAVGANRNTWVNRLEVQEQDILLVHIQEGQRQWQDNAWLPTHEFEAVLAKIILEHLNTLTKKNEEAINSGDLLEPVMDSTLIVLERLWNKLFPERKLETTDYFRVRRLDTSSEAPPYRLQQMSDGERAVLYMAARVMTAEHPIILVDEPELHMHSRLSVQFWDEAENLRPDCRFVYVTHDLNFARSRRGAKFLIARSNEKAQAVLVDDIPSSVITEVLGAATLPFYTKRIFFFEGESGRGFASEFFSAWFDDAETFAIPAGNRDSVCAAVAGLWATGVVGAEVIGLVDRDFYSDEMLGTAPTGVTVLPLHEIESILCEHRVVAEIAQHLGKVPKAVWDAFLDQVRQAYQGKALNYIIANRVRSRIGDLLDGAFDGTQVQDDLTATITSHCEMFSDVPARIKDLFQEEAKRVQDALDSGDKQMLVILPGKRLLKILAQVLGLGNESELTGLVVRSLNRTTLGRNDPLHALGVNIENALRDYLPPRET